jgi:hypothetical protein
MARNAVLLALLVFAVAGCVGRAAHIGADTAPSASVAGADLAGHWRGDLYETAGTLVTGSQRVDVTIAEDGTWRGTIGKATASGAARMKGDRLVISGSAQAPDGGRDPVYFSLTGDEHRRWGVTTTTFSGRDARATVSLERAAKG